MCFISSPAWNEPEASPVWVMTIIIILVKCKIHQPHCEPSTDVSVDAHNIHQMYVTLTEKVDLLL